MKIASVMWNSYVPMVLKANEGVGFELKIFSNRTLEENPARVEEALKAWVKIFERGEWRIQVYG